MWPNHCPKILVGKAPFYFEALFLYDWGRIGKPKIDESVPAVELVSDFISVLFVLTHRANRTRVSVALTRAM